MTSEVPNVESANLDRLVQDIVRLEEIFEGWDDNQRGAVQAYRDSVEALHREAFRRLIKSLKEEPAALAAMKTAAADEIVYSVLRHFDLVKASLHERVEAALDAVRPMLASHGGGVELVTVKPPDAVEVKFLGACEGCPASMLTFVAGVQKAIQDACPEIESIEQVRGFTNGAGEANAVQFVSPFALNSTSDWAFAAKLDDVPEGGVVQLNLDGEDIVLSRNGRVVSCFQNACAHMGMAIDMGEIADGIITCPHHGFRYDLRSGECLTAPEVALRSHAVRVIGPRIEVRLSK